MTAEGALALLDLARQARWTFPSSSGRPVARETPPWAEALLAARGRMAEAAQVLARCDAVELAARAWRTWILARDFDAGREFLRPILAAAPLSKWRALALYGDALFAFWQGAHAEARARCEAALADAQTSGDPEALALAHLAVARAAVTDGDASLATTHARESRRHAVALPEPFRQAPLHMHAQARLLAAQHAETPSAQAADLNEAAALFTESLDLNRRIGDTGMVAVELHNLGFVQARRGDADAAERHFEECARLGDNTDSVSRAFLALYRATVAFVRGDRDRARTSFDFSEATFRESGQNPAAEAEFAWLRESLAEGW
ncbi:MAG: hypothetical protein HYY18_20360 [Planctomycetes bacterium]|nr:hypothetical protein [Planctomycetota bacterium]